MRTGVLKQNAFFLMDNLEDRVSVDALTDRFIDAGIIQNDPNDYRGYQIMQARELIRAHRKVKEVAGDVQHELANLFEINEDGSRTNYYKPCGKLSPQESLQHLQYWKKKVGEDVARLNRYRAFYKRMHGRKLTRILPRDLFDFAEAR